MNEIDQRLRNISLTQRERDILRLLTDGLTDSEIARAGFLTVGTVKWYNRQIYNKLGVRNRTEAATLARSLDLLSHASRPAGSSIPKPIHNLPAQITPFIGRSRELAELKMALNASRLVTLTGPPGTGKTRLGLEVASALLEHYPDGVYFVSLALIQDAHLVAHTVAQVLSIKDSSTTSIVTMLTAALQGKRILLVLDNFEHLLTAASLVSDLLAKSPQLTILITSREVLRLYGEQEFPVPPLQLPDLKSGLSAAALAFFEAIELFTQRARTVQPTFTLSDDNAASVAMICVHLDGLPLAIELAAARIKFYAPQMLLLRLSSRLEALGESERDRPARQRTLRATLAWSYDLLTPEEQRLFARLGIFAGGFTLADTEALCQGDLSVAVGEGLESLLNKSLLRQMQSDLGEPRFMMLETMREYALEKLAEHDEIALIRERHASYFLALAELASKELHGAYATEWLTRLENHHDNLRAALQWYLASRESGQRSLRFVGHLANFWKMRGYLTEGRALLADALSRKSADAPTQLRANALRSAGILAYLQCDYSAARQSYKEALAIDRQLGDQGGTAHTLMNLGDMETSIGNYDTAEALVHQAAEILQRLGDISGSAYALDFLSWCVLRSRGDYPQAATWFEHALALSRQAGDISGTALAYSGLGEIAVRQGDLERATHLLGQSLKLRQELGDKWGIAASLGSLGWVAQRQGDFERALALLGESLHIRQQIGDPGGMAWCLEKLAEIAHVQNEDGRAALCLGAAAVLRTSTHSAIDPTDRPEYDQIIACIYVQLGTDVFKAVWAEGQATPIDDLIAYLSIASPASTDTK
jgi:predicted ATPase/DNA-binding CsgD family transcriptional regulator/Tfp pilus assembly protein PilF